MEVVLLIVLHSTSPAAAAPSWPVADVSREKET